MATKGWETHRVGVTFQAIRSRRNGILTFRRHRNVLAVISAGVSSQPVVFFSPRFFSPDFSRPASPVENETLNLFSFFLAHAERKRRAMRKRARGEAVRNRAAHGGENPDQYEMRGRIPPPDRMTIGCGFANQSTGGP